MSIAPKLELELGAEVRAQRGAVADDGGAEEGGREPLGRRLVLDDLLELEPRRDRQVPGAELLRHGEPAIGPVRGDDRRGDALREGPQDGRPAPGRSK